MVTAGRLRVAESLAGVCAAQWNALAGGNPFASFGFLEALLESGCASARSGWRPQFLLLERDGALAGAMPLFVKTHSRGEYVFDWAWADAYARHGLDYYPKLVSAVPFTPVSGPRLLAADDAAREALAAAALEAAREFSSLHVLFAPQAEARLLQERGMLLRRTVQFHWSNAGYADFEAFLARMAHRRRKNIRQERRRVREAGVQCRWLRGREIERAHWEFFHRCYANTYAEHGMRPYLDLEFFLRASAAMPGSFLLVLAERRGSRAMRSTGATGAPSSTCRCCISRPATTRGSSTPSPTASRASRAVRRASTSCSGGCCPWRRCRRIGWRTRASPARSRTTWSARRWASRATWTS
jgi:predicted N-acyltransferase